MFSFLSDSSEIFGLTSITDLKVFEGGGGAVDEWFQALHLR